MGETKNHLYLTWEEMQNDVRKLAHKIRSAHEEYAGALVITRGGLGRRLGRCQRASYQAYRNILRGILCGYCRHVGAKCFEDLERSQSSVYPRDAR